MSRDFSEIIEQGVFGMFILSMLVDAILSATWNRMYFTSGLTRFVRRIPVTPRHTNIPLPSRFESEFQPSWSSSFAFKEITPNIYGFRERAIAFRLMRYSPLMHGMLLFDFANDQVVDKGFANWSILYFSLVTSKKHMVRYNC